MLLKVTYIKKTVTWLAEKVDWINLAEHLVKI